jgi:hypothetical protein
LEVRKQLTTESPVIHFLLTDGVKNRIHVSCSLRGVDISSVLSHGINTGFGLILSFGEHFPGLGKEIPWVVIDLRCSPFGRHIAAGLRNRPIDSTWIEAEQVKAFSYDLIYGLTKSPEKIDSAAYIILVVVICLRTKSYLQVLPDSAECSFLQ